MYAVASHLYSCGRGIKVAAGYMAFNVPAPSSPNFPNLFDERKETDHWPNSLKPSDYTPQRAVSRAADAGAICVKAFVESGFGMFNWPYLHTETLQKDPDRLLQLTTELNEALEQRAINEPKLLRVVSFCD